MPRPVADQREAPAPGAGRTPSDAKRTTPPTPTELIRLIALEYYRWDYVCSRSAQPGTSARDRFESNLEHALEQAGLDPRALYQEAAGNAIFNR